MSAGPHDWKLKLRYGLLSTPSTHLTVLADGVAGDEMGEGFACPPGRAVMAMKVWAASSDEAADMGVRVGAEVGFHADGRVEVFETEREQPPGEVPFGDDIAFTPCAA